MVPASEPQSNVLACPHVMSDVKYGTHVVVRNASDNPTEVKFTLRGPDGSLVGRSSFYINGQGTFDFLHRHLNWPKP